MIASFSGFSMMPFWAKWWAAALRRTKVARHFQVVGVVVLSLVTLLITNVGPLTILMMIRGTPQANLAEPSFPISLLILFGPGVVMQSILAFHFALRDEKIPT